MKAEYNIIVMMITACIGMLLTIVTPAAAADTYRVDPVHSSVVFKVKHLGVSFFFGRFNNVSGAIVVDDAAVSNSSVDISVKSEDVDTFNAKRDGHLKGEDFFHADRFPIIGFKSRSVRKADDATYEVAGDLTFHGAVRPLTVKVRRTGHGKDPWGNYRMGFETSFTIKRSEFGMDYMLSGIGDEVRIMVSVEGVRR